MLVFATARALFLQTEVLSLSFREGSFLLLYVIDVDTTPTYLETKKTYYCSEFCASAPPAVLRAKTRRRLRCASEGRVPDIANWLTRLFCPALLKQRSARLRILLRRVLTASAAQHKLAQPLAGPVPKDAAARFQSVARRNRAKLAELPIAFGSH